MLHKSFYYLYKPLKNLEHFTQLQDYLNGKIWFTRLDEFNDPFERFFIYKPAASKEILQSEMLFDEYYCNGIKFDPSITKETFREKLSSPEAEKIIGRGKSITYWFKSHGALCLTSDYSNIPMWAHYANDYQGYCVVFEFDWNQVFQNKKVKETYHSFENFYNEYLENVINPSSETKQEILRFNQEIDAGKKFNFVKVKYKDKPQEIKETIWKEEILAENKYEFYKYMILNSIAVKFEQWRYEDEFRLIVNTNSKTSGLMDLTGYPFIKVTGVIMGEKIGSNLDKDVIDFIKGRELSGLNLGVCGTDEKLKNFIAMLCKQKNKETYIAECSSEAYKIIKNKYILDTLSMR